MGNVPKTTDWKEIKEYFNCQKMYIDDNNVPVAKLRCPVCNTKFEKQVSYLRYKIKSMPHKEVMCCSNACTSKANSFKIKDQAALYVDKKLPYLGDAIVGASGTPTQKGRIGEFIVMTHLLSLGHDAFLTNQNSPYDVVLDYNDTLYKIQVKACLKAKPSGNSPLQYTFPLNSCKYGHYSPNNIDIMAFVALDLTIIAYVPFLTDRAKSFIFTPPGWTSTKKECLSSNIDKYPLEQAINDLQEYRLNGKLNKKSKNYFFWDKKAKRDYTRSRTINN